MVEIQATAEGFSFSDDEFVQLLALAKKGIAEITQLQKETLGIA